MSEENTETEDHQGDCVISVIIVIVMVASKGINATAFRIKATNDRLKFSTHGGLNKIALICQPTFQNVFSSINKIELLMKFH